MRDAADKRTLIMDAATAVFSRNGFHSSTIEMIAEAAGIGKGTVYLYFSSKEEILRELVFRAMEAQIEEAREALSALDPVDRLMGVLTAGRVFLRENADLVKVIVTQATGVGRSADFKERMAKFAAEYTGLLIRAFEMGQKEGVFRKDLASDVAGRLLSGLRWGLTMELVSSQAVDVPEELVAEVRRFVMNGIGIG